MNAKLVPVFFPKSKDEDFDTQLENLKKLLAGHAEFLPSAPLGPKLADEASKADAVVFPQHLSGGIQYGAGREGLGVAQGDEITVAHTA